VWGPEYCSAVRVAREFDSAEIVTDPSPHACLEVINKLFLDCARRKQLSKNAMKMYHDRFHPTKIHQVLLNQVSELITKPMDTQVGYADYIGNKFTNACVMRSFALNFPACFFGIHPDGGLNNQVDKKSQNIVQLVDQKTTTELNGNIFSTQGEILELYEKIQP
jgi:hypothetical protein